MAQETGDGGSDVDEEREEYAWARQSPRVTLRGTFEDLIYNADGGIDAEQNGNSFGVLLSDATVEDGTVFENRDRDGGLARDDSDRSSLDHRFVNTEDEKASTDEVDGTIISVNDGTSELAAEPSEIAEEKVLVWYGSMSGQTIGRTLDFNGYPTASFTDDGYLVKGLYQFAEGWWESSNKGALVSDGFAPRVARFPVPRSDYEGEEIVIRTDWASNHGSYDERMHWVEVYDPQTWEEHGEDGETLEMLYNEEDAESILSENEITMALYHGNGWEDEPEDATGFVEGTSFDVEVGSETLTVNEQQFADNIAEALADEGLTLDDVSDTFVVDQASDPSNAGQLGVDPTNVEDEIDVGLIEERVDAQLADQQLAE